LAEPLVLKNKVTFEKRRFDAFVENTIFSTAKSQKLLKENYIPADEDDDYASDDEVIDVA